MSWVDSEKMSPWFTRCGASRPQRRLLLGLYAEERFVEANRDLGWRKVADRFAPQRDVWRRVDGRIQYAQVENCMDSATQPLPCAI